MNNFEEILNIVESQISAGITYYDEEEEVYTNEILHEKVVRVDNYIIYVKYRYNKKTKEYFSCDVDYVCVNKDGDFIDFHDRDWRNDIQNIEHMIYIKAGSRDYIQIIPLLPISRGTNPACAYEGPVQGDLKYISKENLERLHRLNHAKVTEVYDKYDKERKKITADFVPIPAETVLNAVKELNFEALANGFEESKVK
ncbi:MAG: hypothetical protein IJI22_00980 [Bacilli bacterium]|nr:hypothetical protein [Bacilli bacterium]